MLEGRNRGIELGASEAVDRSHFCAFHQRHKSTLTPARQNNLERKMVNNYFETPTSAHHIGQNVSALADRRSLVTPSTMAQTALLHSMQRQSLYSPDMKQSI